MLTNAGTVAPPNRSPILASAPALPSMLTQRPTTTTFFLALLILQSALLPQLNQWALYMVVRGNGGVPMAIN